MTQAPVEFVKLNEEIHRLLTQISTVECNTPEYAKLIDQLVKLHRVRENEANIGLKILDNQTKQEENLRNQELKQAEMLIKQEENLRNQELKQAEMLIKQRETEASANLKDVEAEEKKRTLDKFYGISPETLAIITANLAGIAVIIGYERVNVITSKAFTLIQKLR